MIERNSTWLTVKEAAQQAKVSTWTIYRACELGKLRHVRLEGRRAIRLTRDALDEWLLRHERAANVVGSPVARDVSSDLADAPAGGVLG